MLAENPHTGSDLEFSCGCGVLVEEPAESLTAADPVGLGRESGHGRGRVVVGARRLGPSPWWLRSAWSWACRNVRQESPRRPGVGIRRVRRILRMVDVRRGWPAGRAGAVAATVDGDVGFAPAQFLLQAHAWRPGTAPPTIRISRTASSVLWCSPEKTGR